MDSSRALAGQAALVTGASQGIGRAIALQLAQAGCAVALVGRDAAALGETAAACAAYGSAALPLPADLADLAALPGLVEQCVAELGQLNILVNNAGIFDWAAVLDADLARWDALMDVNLRAAMHLTHHAAPQIVRGQRGAIIFIASMAAKRAFGTNAAYVASKHGLLGFAGSVFEDLRARNVKVCTICPGYVNAGASQTMDLPPERFTQLIQPEDIARTVLFVLGFPDSACPTEILLSPQQAPF